MPSRSPKSNLAGLLLVLFASGVSSVRGEDPLYLHEPFDRITLNSQNDSAEFVVRTLDLPDRKLPDPLPRLGAVTVHLLDRPEPALEIRWSAVVRVELFEGMVLVEAERLVEEDRREEAYDCFEFLLDFYPKLPGLDAAIDNYLYEEAKSLHLKNQYEGALAMLHALFERTPDWPGLDNAMGIATEKLVARYVEADNRWAARSMLRSLNKRFADHSTVDQWESRFEQEAALLLTRAERSSEAGRLDEAHEAIRRAAHVWPRLEGAREFAESIQKRYPRVTVGVTLPATSVEPNRLHDWASHRSSRLLYRTLTEFAGHTADGSQYVCPLGEMTVKELGLRLEFRLRADLRWAGGDSVMTGYDLSRHLLAMTDPNDPAYRMEWAELLASVSVEDVFTTQVHLARLSVRPEALLQTPVVPYTLLEASEEPEWTNGPYVVDARKKNETVYVADTHYFADTAGRPREIVERYLPSASDGLAALVERRIDVLDRVNPWELEDAREMKDIVVAPYRMARVHLLIPNLQRPLWSNAKFRRAVLYGIHREAILGHLLDAERRPGCRVLSGPFSAGVSRGDTLDYAYDTSIDPRAYDPRLAITLARLATIEVGEMVSQQGGDSESLFPVVLAYPPHEIAQVACADIKSQLELIGVSVELREVLPGDFEVIPEDVDLLYAECAMWEPVVDARRLLGAGGMSRGCSPYMSLALRQLDEAVEWVDVRDRLRQIHLIAHREVAVLPLWQLTDHFAYHRSMAGIESQPISLYQDVENWQATFFYPEDEE